VKETMKIDIRGRGPKRQAHPQFLKYEDQPWNLIEEEVKKTMVQDQVVHNINN
jgi:hypothetical protein